MFQDIGIGFLLAILTSYLFKVDLTSTVLLLAVIFSLLPDIDLILPKRMTGGHRGLLHAPFLYFVSGIFVYITCGPVIGFMFFAGTFYHLIHDTFFLGWGIKWLWPLSSRSFKFFPDKDAKITSRFVMSWLPEEEEIIKQEYNNPHWIKDFYFRIGLISVSEYSIFIISIICLYLYW
jgi:hypothetical protein